MTILAERAHVIQNLGLIDRVVRLVVGVGLISVAYYLSVHTEMKLHLWDGYLAFVIALYPLFTAMLGWDPFYKMADVRSCSDTGKNQCGTLPYEMKAMGGHAPKFCEGDTEHSLESCHDEPEDRPRHKTWKVD